MLLMWGGAVKLEKFSSSSLKKGKHPSEECSDVSVFYVGMQRGADLKNKPLKIGLIILTTLLATSLTLFCSLISMLFCPLYKNSLKYRIWSLLNERMSSDGYRR